MMKMMTKAKEQMTRFLREEDAVGVIEMLLLLLLIGAVVIFRDQLTDLLNDIFKTIQNDAAAV